MWREAVVLLTTAVMGSSSLYMNYIFPQVVYMGPGLHRNQAVKYDCPSEGFFVNPDNCSQFYRCVDYTGTGQVYSVYAFECPKYHVFILDGDNSTCIPGTECAPGQQTAAHIASSTKKPSGTTSGTVGITLPVSGGSSITTGSTGGLHPIPERPSSTSRPEITAPVASVPVTSEPVTSAPVVADPAQTSESSTGDCQGEYLQHEVYCNVYYKCSNSEDKFLCPRGSVFDTVRQMCRIQAADEDLCGGKSIYSSSFRYVPGASLGSLLPESLISVTPQKIIQVPQYQHQYPTYFNQHQVLRSNQKIQAIPSLTTRFTQAVVLPQPAPENIHPRMYYQVTDSDSHYNPEPELVHPRQYYKPIDSELKGY